MRRIDVVGITCSERGLGESGPICLFGCFLIEDVVRDLFVVLARVFEGLVVLCLCVCVCRVFACCFGCGYNL